MVSVLNHGVLAIWTMGMMVGLGALGLALIVAGVLLYRRNRISESEVDEDEGQSISLQVESLSDNPDTIMDAILALDDLYQEGELPEDAYQKRRAELKDRLEDLMKNGA